MHVISSTVMKRYISINMYKTATKIVDVYVRTFSKTENSFLNFLLILICFLCQFVELIE
jgi:hypothetical protein